MTLHRTKITPLQLVGEQVYTMGDEDNKKKGHFQFNEIG